MNLVRLGHYFTPRGAGDGTVTGGCQTALVCGVSETPTESEGGQETVNLHVFRTDGMSLGAREGVVVGTPGEGQASFHLSTDCPWHR